MTIDYAQELQTNPLLKLQMADQNMLRTLTTNPDPKLAEMLIENKLKQVGLTDKEIAIVYIRDGLKYTQEKAMQETGLSQIDLDGQYDTAAAKINNYLNGNAGILGNLKATFGNNPTNSGGLYTNKEKP